MDDEKEDYSIPVRRSLTERILIAGVPKSIAILNGTLAAAFILGYRAWWLIPLHIIAHLVCVAYTKKDPQFFDCYRRYTSQKKYYYT